MKLALAPMIAEAEAAAEVVEAETEGGVETIAAGGATNENLCIRKRR